MPRTRTTSNRKGLTTVDVVDNPGSPWSAIAPYGWSGSTNTITEDLFPNFGRRKSRGEVMVGNLLMVKEERLGTNQIITVGPHPSWGTRTITGDIGGFISATSDPTISMDPLIYSMGQCVFTEAYADMKKSSLMIGEALGTLNRTLGMLRRPMSSLQDLLLMMAGEVKRRRRKKSSVYALVPGQVWLEYRYGVRPAVSDIAHITAMVENQLSSPYGGRRVVRTSRREVQNFTGHAVASGYPGCDILVETATFQKDVSVSSGIIYELLVDSASGHVAKEIGSRITDLPATLWELVPWSFVADWFVNVGDWIRAVTPDPSVRVLGSWTTEVHKSVNSFSGCKWQKYISTAPATTYQGSFTPPVITTLKVKRTANPSLPTTPVWRGNTLSIQNQVTGLALLHGLTTNALKAMRH